MKQPLTMLSKTLMKIPEHAKKVFSWKTFDTYQWEQEMFDGTTKTFEKLRRNPSVDTIAVSESGEIYILEEEHPGRSPFYGLVWWTCEDWEEPIDTAKRELLEETGLVSDDWELFGSYEKSSRIDYTSNIFIARNCKRIQDQNLDSGEKIQIRMVNWEDFLNIVADPKFRVQEFALETLRYVFLWKETELKNRILK
ncbi:MAG: NUDIX hydrolase [uncultured bacterium (gcode 4)]|uniref:NUDIX hydrolase n=1 Tax=uncultured bacterium (gcode 4) TaxID=1234023 RepID=K1ZJY5_9BACT|nr:MAG: NUDIX hydrolase [uncultured bacterium (gcode 4)]